jgi:hypothetical protein
MRDTRRTLSTSRPSRRATQQLDHPGDDGQRVVDLVRHPARHFAERRHLGARLQRRPLLLGHPLGLLAALDVDRGDDDLLGVIRHPREDEPEGTRPRASGGLGLELEPRRVAAAEAVERRRQSSARPQPGEQVRMGQRRPVERQRVDEERVRLLDRSSA